MHVKISIIIPVYNAEIYLSRCIDSVLDQTYSNFELILINDGSTDSSLELCMEYANIDQRITVINQNNKGPATARNAGLKKAKGAYIGFVDADDFVEKEMYFDMMSIASNRNLDIVVCNFKVYDAEGDYNIIKNNLPYEAELNPAEIKEFFLKPYYGGFKGIIPSLCNKLYKKSFLEEHHLKIDENRVRAEDYWFNFYAFGYAQSAYAVDKAYYHYYNNQGSVMKTLRENQFDLFLKTREELLHQNNKVYQFTIDNKAFGKEFIENSNEFILFAILHHKKGLAQKTLRNKEFLKAYKNFEPDRFHTQLIKLALQLKQFAFAYTVYKVWSKRVN
jgi:glycosyltransferase involved in cell wall biosynthesis